MESSSRKMKTSLNCAFQKKTINVHQNFKKNDNKCTSKLKKMAEILIIN